MSTHNNSIDRDGENFNPLLCFASEASQTAEEVFNMLQDRMETLLKYAYNKDKQGQGHGCRCLDKNINHAILSKITNEPHSVILDSREFEALGSPFHLSMPDVMGTPHIPENYRRSIMQGIKECGSLDPAAALVSFAALDQFDAMAKTFSQHNIRLDRA